MSMTVTMVPLRGPLMNGQIMTPLEKIQHSQNKCMFHWGVAPSDLNAHPLEFFEYGWYYK